MKNYIITLVASALLFSIACSASAREKIPEAQPVSAIAFHANPVQQAEAITALVESYGAVPYAEFIDAIVALCQRADSAESMQILVDLSKRLDKLVFIDVIVALVQKSEYIDPVKLAEWYKLVPFDGGTGCWAIAQKAKKYADEGNAKRVAEMLELYKKFLQEYKERE